MIGRFGYNYLVNYWPYSLHWAYMVWLASNFGGFRLRQPISGKIVMVYHWAHQFTIVCAYTRTMWRSRMMPPHGLSCWPIPGWEDILGRDPTQPATHFARVFRYDMINLPTKTPQMEMEQNLKTMILGGNERPSTSYVIYMCSPRVMNLDPCYIAYIQLQKRLGTEMPSSNQMWQWKPPIF